MVGLAPEAAVELECDRRAACDPERTFECSRLCVFRLPRLWYLLLELTSVHA